MNATTAIKEADRDIEKARQRHFERKRTVQPIPPMGHDSAMMVDDDYPPIEPLYILREVVGEVYHQSPLNYEEW